MKKLKNLIDSNILSESKLNFLMSLENYLRKIENYLDKIYDKEILTFPEIIIAILKVIESAVKYARVTKSFLTFKFIERCHDGVKQI
jgi:hypothetical protein